MRAAKLNGGDSALLGGRAEAAEVVVEEAGGSKTDGAKDGLKLDSLNSSRFTVNGFCRSRWRLIFFCLPAFTDDKQNEEHNVSNL